MSVNLLEHAIDAATRSAAHDPLLRQRRPKRSLLRAYVLTFISGMIAMAAFNVYLGWA